MSVFPPVRKDRVISQLPLVTGAVNNPHPRPPLCAVSREVPASHLVPSLCQYYRREAALRWEEDFNDKVKTACQEQRTGTVG